MKVPLEEIRHLASNGRDLNDYISGLLAKCTPTDPPFISDLILAFNQGGVFMLEAIEEIHNRENAVGRPMDQRFQWRLQVLKDEWGNPVKPGDVIEHVITRSPEHGPGKPMTAGEISVQKLDGSYERNWVERIPYVVDEKGCITCGFVATTYFLNKFGIHKSGAIISHHKVETSGDPQKVPTGGFKHVHYWRFREVDADDYAKLPRLETSAAERKGSKHI